MTKGGGKGKGRPATLVPASIDVGECSKVAKSKIEEPVSDTSLTIDSTVSMEVVKQYIELEFQSSTTKVQDELRS